MLYLYYYALLCSNVAFSNDALLLGTAFPLDEQRVFCPLLAVWLFLRGFSSGKCQWKKCGSIISTVPEVFYKVSV